MDMFCSKCGKQMKETDKVCPSCGNSVNGVVKTSAVGRKICKSCGANIDSSFITCPHCKRVADTGSSIQSSSYKAASYSTNSWAIAGFILSFFSPLLGIIFSAIGWHKIDETGTGYLFSLFGFIISIISISSIVVTIIYWNRLWDAIMAMFGLI